MAADGWQPDLANDWRADNREWLNANAKGKSFADIGGMWGTYWGAFEAVDAGADPVLMLDVNPITDEYKAAIGDREVSFLQGDLHDEKILRKIDQADIVLCSGVIYHCPNPLDTLECLRRITKEHLILTCSAMLNEAANPPNGMVYLPGLTPEQRVELVARNPDVIGANGALMDFAPDEGYWNWFFCFTPSSLRSMLETAGFEVLDERHYPGLYWVLTRPGG